VRKALLIVIIVTLLGGMLAWQMTQNRGYILIAYGNYSIDMTLWAFFLIIGILSVFFVVLKNLIRLIMEPGQKYFKERAALKIRSNQLLVNQGLLQYFEGRWGSARKILEKSAKNSTLPLLSYLVAAIAAYEDGDQKGANKLLSYVEKSIPGNNLITGLARAKMCVREQLYAEALAILQPFYVKFPSHPIVLRLLYLAYRGLKDWESLRRLLAELSRYKVFSKIELQEIEGDVYAYSLTAISTQKASMSEDLINFWHKIPKNLRKEKRVLLEYAAGLHELDESSHAEVLLRAFLKTCWDDRLVKLYGVVEGEDARKQLIFAESWLFSNPDSAELMLALGRLSWRCQLWGKARDYLESSIAIKPQSQAYVDLARIMEHFCKHEESLKCYQKGLSLGARNE
jgi:HemY protein